MLVALLASLRTDGSLIPGWSTGVATAGLVALIAAFERERRLGETLRAEDGTAIPEPSGFRSPRERQGRL